jgi:hypothetical protein
MYTWWLDLTVEQGTLSGAREKDKKEGKNKKGERN